MWLQTRPGAPEILECLRIRRMFDLDSGNATLVFNAHQSVVQSLARNSHYASCLSEVAVNFVHQPNVSFHLFAGSTLTMTQRWPSPRKPTFVSKSYKSVDQSCARNSQSSRGLGEVPVNVIHKPIVSI